ncbi:Protein of unknown function (DUF3084) [Thermanaerovibrio velox DSM 12556]|uniref:DUF3084 domain-containing protein n=1 Tax=Thermanaerovibrio velox DSM 12556 TaxID=926567 RepID=H0USH5_9BACT|nr:DUF3084 domain-containing protein [Thermanaerovibrio velox]EHM10264.1 Protein of unknown function (DUF3084) [Thermanaerovibrio velox DSM 12556]
MSFWQDIGELNWQLILALVLISAVVAYVGDVLGMRVGKKRVSLFGLRPRHTSSVITTVTGVLITLSTLVVLGFASSTVRSALLGMKIINRQMQELNVKLEDSRRELSESQGRLFESHKAMDSMVSRLKETESRLVSASGELEMVRRKYDGLVAKTVELADKKSQLEGQLRDLRSQRDRLMAEVADLRLKRDALEKELQQMRSGRIMVFAGELLYQVSWDGRGDPGEAVSTLLNRARASLALRFGLKPEAVILRLDPQEEAKVLGVLREGGGGRRVLRLFASSNATIGEALDCSVKVYRSVLVVRDGEVLAAERFERALNPSDAEQVLYGILKEVNQRVVSRGLLKDPLSGTVGGVTAAEFFDAVERMSGASGPFQVTVVAKGDAYTEGPLEVTIRVER